jgi:hypothetical protein
MDPILHNLVRGSDTWGRKKGLIIEKMIGPFFFFGGIAQKMVNPYV